MGLRAFGLHRNTASAALLTSGVLAPLVMSAPAKAQLFDQFLPADVYGAGTEPNTTVTSRLRTGYDNGGVRLGTVVVRPRLTESFGYESNVLGKSKATGSGLVQTNASVDAQSENSRGSFLASANVYDNRYTDLSNQSYTSWNARVGGNLNVGRDVASLVVTHDNLTQTQRDLDVPQLATPLAIAVDALRAGYRTVLNRLSLLPSVDVARYRYNSGIANGALYDQSYRNRFVVTPGITAAYEFATRRSAVVVFRDSVASYSLATPTSPKRNFNDAAVLAGVDYDLNGSLRARALAGYEIRTFNSAAYRTIQAPIAELTLIYNPTGLTTVTGLLARRIQDTADEAVAGVTTLTGRLRLDHEFRRNVILTAVGGISRNDYAAGGGTQTLYSGAASATYLINRYAAASATYDILTRSGSTTPSLGGTTSSGSSFVDHRFLLQLRFAL